jgi:hypothetical protein
MVRRNALFPARFDSERAITVLGYAGGGDGLSGIPYALGLVIDTYSGTSPNWCDN